MLYTGKGDQGTSKLFKTESSVRLSKSDVVFEVLGTLDELNSFLGLARALAIGKKYSVPTHGTFGDIVERLQQDLFIIQAEIAGSDMTIAKEKVEYLELITNSIEELLPPIKTFFIPGRGELGARFDIARTVARRAERSIVSYHEKGGKVGAETMRYINRLSSVLYAFARLANQLDNISEVSPKYQ